MADLAKAVEGAITGPLGMILKLTVLAGIVGLAFTALDDIYTAFTGATFTDPTVTAIVNALAFALLIIGVIGLFSLAVRSVGTRSE